MTRLRLFVRRYVRRSPVTIPRITLGLSLTYLALLVLLPLSTIAVLAGSMSWRDFVSLAFEPRALAAYRLSFATASAAATVNAVTGVAIAWVLTRHQFAGRRFVDAAIDLPFALPTAVAGVALTSLHRPAAFAWPGIVIALTFVGLPFVVRSVQGVLVNLPLELEDAAATLGASRLQAFRQVILPALLPAIATGFSLAFARGLGEYGSIAFISGNIPYRTEMATQLIAGRVEQFEYQAAAAAAVVILAGSLLALVLVSGIQHRSTRVA